MRTIRISQRSKAVNALLQQARRENVIIRSADGEEFILAEIDDFDREIELTRQNRQLMKLLDTRAKKSGTVSLAEAKRQLGVHERAG
jgi:hypothetical protein